MKLKLSRLSRSDFATYGNITDDEDKPFGVTLELPWADNAHGTSCIPAGVYTFDRLPAGEGRHAFDVFRSMDVPDRIAIEIHPGNLPKDTEGCILLGSNFGTVDDQPGITGSQAAFARFMDAMKGINSFVLTVTDPT